MIRLIAIFCLLSAALALPAKADEKTMTLSVPEALSDSGLWKYILPRFSLKTGVRVSLGDDGDLTLSQRGSGAAILQQGQMIYKIDTPRTKAAERFADWLQSDVGRRTIDGYTPADGETAITAASLNTETAQTTVFTGDAAMGETLSLSQCGRCHVVSDKNRMNGLGSTPSFALLRTFPDWEERFTAFYVLRPHGAFTQIEDVTEPFDATLPSPIAPVEITLDDLDAILAFVSLIPPANLGAPIQHQ